RACHNEYSACHNCTRLSGPLVYAKHGAICQRELFQCLSSLACSVRFPIIIPERNSQQAWVETLAKFPASSLKEKAWRAIF
ncbi:MAG: hypothetical protein WBD49_19110, partial [Bradyrhizobium sp.]